jgi:indolepyruvate ferredoxin oxidoreductase beta subunit
MHPRTQEIADTLRAPLGRFILNTAWLRGLMDRMTRKRRVVKTSSLRGFLLLYMVAAFKPLRPRSLPHRERASGRMAGDRSALRGDELRSRHRNRGGAQSGQRLRPHARAWPRAFRDVVAMLPSLSQRPAGAAQLASLRKAAYADDTGAALNAAIEKMKEPAAT